VFDVDGDIENDNTSQAFGDHSPLLASWKHDRFLAMYGLWIFELRHGGFISYVRCKVMAKFYTMFVMEQCKVAPFAWYSSKIK
jgi:hypothetical protein